MDTTKQSYINIWEELGFQLEDVKEKNKIINVVLNKGISRESNECMVRYLKKKLNKNLHSSFIVLNNCIKVLIPDSEKNLSEDLKKLKTLI